MKKSLTNFFKIFIYPVLEYFILILLLMFLLHLGNWQLHRAKQKEQLLHQYQTMQALNPTTWTSSNKNPQPFQPLIIHGKALDKFFYLDNQFYQHQIGFDVFIPVLLDDDSIVMVDEGWLKANPQRNELPRPYLLPSNSWQGQVYYPAKSSIKLGKMVDNQQGQIYVIESVDFVELQKILKHPVHPWVLRLAPEAQGMYKRDWQVVNLLPNRHRAYALQWYTMAFVVGIIFLWRIIKHAKK